MKVFYLAQENFGCVVYADNKDDAFEKMKCQRKELLETLGLPLDIKRWGIVEFTSMIFFLSTERMNFPGLLKFPFHINKNIRHHHISPV